MNILLAEDTEDLADLISALIQSTYNTRVVWKPNGAEALEEFKNCTELNFDETYNFIITDKCMPIMTGPELAKNVHQLDPTMPIVLWTSDKYIQQTIPLFIEVVDKSNTVLWVSVGLKEYILS